MTPEKLIERLERLTGADGSLDRWCAVALGWSERKVTRLGLNGRTPGRWMWFDPEGNGPQACPRLTGPRRRAATLAALREIAGRAALEQG